MPANRSVARAAAALLCALTATACLGEVEPRAAAVDCTAPGVTADQVEVGLLFPDSGTLAGAFNAARAGFDARIGLANAEGGVHGRQIAYRWRDDKGDPPENLMMSQDLVQREGVFGVLEASTASSGGAGYLYDEGVPVLGIAVEEVWSRYRNMFAFNYFFTSGESVDTFGRFVRGQGGTRAMIVEDPTAGAASGRIAEQFATSLRAAGVEVGDDAVVDFTTGVSSADRLAQDMIAKGVDTLVDAVGGATAAEVVSAARRAGVPLKVMLTNAAVTAADLQRYGPALGGLTFFTTYIPFQHESPALDAYRDAVARYAPQLGDPDQTLALASYVIADMLVTGLEQAGECPTRQGFVDALREVKGYTAGGLINRVDFDADFGRLSECYAFVRVTDAGDGFEVVDPEYCGSRLPG